MFKILSFTILLLTLSACQGLPKGTSVEKLWQSPTPTFTPNASKAERIATIALREHQAWGEPFITVDGRIAKYNHYESENSHLADGSLAWERVVAYWRDSGVLARLDRALPYQSCDKADKGVNASTNICRAFASDVAWSAAFVSYVMTQAGVDFDGSPRHYDYIHTAWLGHGSYRTADPRTTPLALGDMLCYLRGERGKAINDYQDLSDYLAKNTKGLPAHCDIVVDNTHAGEIWLVGGNVLHTVMLRKMAVDTDGKVILPSETDECTPNDENHCNANRQNWVVVLKLQE